MLCSDCVSAAQSEYADCLHVQLCGGGGGGNYILIVLIYVLLVNLIPFVSLVMLLFIETEAIRC